MTYQPPHLVQKYLDQEIKRYSPKASIKLKSEHWLFKVLGFILKPFNPDFNNRYYTTLGTTIYIPDSLRETAEPDLLNIVAHEGEHIKDYERWKRVFFVLAYGFPQILAGLSFLSVLSVFFGPMWLLWLISLVFLAPIPAPGRLLFELNGYKTGYIFGKVVWGWGEQEFAQTDDWVIEQLSKKWYYWTFPFPNTIRKMLVKNNRAWMHDLRYLALEEFLKDNVANH